MLPNRQSGLSLVELMIALLLSTFLILGVTQIYIDNKRSYAFQQNLSGNQESARYAQIFLQQTLAKAGYKRRPDESSDEVFKAVTAGGCAFAKGQTVLFVSASEICIRYQPRDHTERNCLGNVIDSSLTTPYTKRNNAPIERLSLDLSNGKQTLKCSFVDPEYPLVSETSADIFNNLADLRFELGVGSAGNPQTITSFVKAATTAPVLAVRYTTLFRSSAGMQRDATSADTALANWIALTGATTAQVTAMKTADKGNLYQVAQNTVMLRNLMP